MKVSREGECSENIEHPSDRKSCGLERPVTKIW